MSETSARLQLRVIPGASRSEVVGRYGEGWKVRVAAPAEHGRANEAVLRLLAEALSVPRAHLSVAAGAARRDKVILLAGLSLEDAELRLSSNL
jgi:uncharacterized protein